MNQNNNYNQRQDPNFTGNQKNNFRAENVPSQNYTQPPASVFNRASQPQNVGGDPGSQIVSGFLGQSSNQPPTQAPVQQFNQPQDMSRSRNLEPTPGFQFNPDIGSSGTNPLNGVPPVAPPMGVPINSSSADPQTMDIGALNRMAEYYATNSDYPKVSSV